MHTNTLQTDKHCVNEVDPPWHMFFQNKRCSPGHLVDLGQDMIQTLIDSMARHLQALNDNDGWPSKIAGHVVLWYFHYLLVTVDMLIWLQTFKALEELIINE